MIKKIFQIMFNLESMMKKFLEKTLENYRKKKRFKLRDTYLKKYFDVLKKTQKILN